MSPHFLSFLYPAFQSARRFLGLGVVISTLGSAFAESCPSLALNPGEAAISRGETATATVTVSTLPVGKPVAILMLCGWLQAKRLAGAGRVLKVTLNGIPLDHALGRQKDIQLENGSKLPLFTERQGWTLFYAPNPEKLRSKEDNGYFVTETFDPADLRLVLPSMPAREWKFEFFNSQVDDGSAAITIELRDIQVDFLSEEEANAYHND